MGRLATVRRISIGLFTVSCLLFPIVSCSITFNKSEDNLETKRSILERHRELWNKAGIHDYTYDLIIECGACNLWGHFLVTVQSDRTYSAVGDTNYPGHYEENMLAYIPTINGLFEKVGNALAMSAYEIAAEYDSVLGYPRKIRIDYRGDVSSDEYTYRADSVAAL